MPLTPIFSVNDGPRMTVNMLLKAPTILPRRVLKALDNQFLADFVLRQGPTPGGGYVGYRETSPLYSDDDVEIVQEFGEIPVLSGAEGALQVTKVTKRAGAIVVSQEMQDRNDMDAVNTQITRARNTMIRSWDKALFNAFLNNTNVLTFAASAAWSDPTNAKIRRNLAVAQEMIRSAVPSTSQGDDYLGFEPDTIIVPGSLVPTIFDNDEVNKIYQGNLADQNLRYTGTLPNKIFGMDVLVTRSSVLGGNRVIVMERNTVGFRSDERALQATPLYRDNPRETYRTDIVRSTAMALDQPKAACVITGV